jgi:DNA modification methylase
MTQPDLTTCTADLDKVRHIEGFPLGKDADICQLSDPPYYTAYPNPHIAEFIAQHGQPYDEATDTYHCEPFVGDVSEGKNDPIYNAHSYHTKVPYKAIMPFIEHYTQPGDIVFDGFCGTGMTGVAAQMLGRKAILCDLSPAATFIAYNYNIPSIATDFERESKRILTELEEECRWMYETQHIDGRKGLINFTVWSSVHQCPYCQFEFALWDAAVDATEKVAADEFECLHCGAVLDDKVAPRVRDESGQGKLIPVLIDYQVGKERHQKKPNEFDFQLIERIASSTIPYWYPSEKVMFIGEGWGDMYVPMHHRGISRVYQFYTARNLWSLAALHDKIVKTSTDDIALKNGLLALFTSVAVGLTSKMTRYNFEHRGNGYLSGTLYIPSYSAETRVDKVARAKLRDLIKMYGWKKRFTTSITTQSTTELSNVPNDAIDYVFVDPPFGRNLMYSELNFIWESWLRVYTRNEREAIINKSQKKQLGEYRELMRACFEEMYRVLKPGRWITIEFHNSKASVWNAIQESLSKAGFVVAQVAALDKKQHSYKQIVEAGSVKNDLIINAYKPMREFEARFLTSVGVGQERAFIAQHLDRLPPATNIERTREMLYSRLLAYYIQRGYEIQYNADQFYQLLRAEFKEADGYWFRDEEQLREYEIAKSKATDAAEPQAPLFVLDERSAIQWLKHFLRANPSTFSEIHSEYLQALQATDDQIPELRPLLEENFGLPDDEGRYHWPNPNLQIKLEQERQARLLRLFNEYLRQAQAGQKLGDVRKEAVLVGFAEAYREKRFGDILTVGRKLGKGLVESSTEIFDFIDIAEAKAGANL